MSVDVHAIPLGVDNCYLLRSEGSIVIDAGMPNHGQLFAKALGRLSVQPRDIHLIVLTHGHWDHIGSAGEIRELTGAPIALHRQEKEWLEKSLKPLPPGVTTWGRIFVGILAAFMPLVHIPAAGVDLVLDDAGLSLAPYGIPGEIVYTPGHSAGSVSVLLEDGSAFVGDLAMNAFPLRLTPGLPVLAENARQVRESWKILLDKGAKTIYPAHGKPFSAAIVRKAL